MAPPENAPSGVLASNELRVVAAGDGTGEFFVPFGEYPNTALDPRTGSKFPCVQVVNRETATKLLTALNSIGGKIARALGAIPIHIGHPDMPGHGREGADRSSYGSVTAAALGKRPVDGAEVEGIAFNVKFNRRGRELMCDEPPAYFFHSPVWPLEVLSAANGMRRVAPIGLHSFGLTNTPAIPVPMISMNEELGVEAPPPPPPPTPTLLERLLAAIGLEQKENSEDDAIAWISMAKAALAKVNAATEAKWKAEDAARLAVANEAPAVDRLLALLDDAATDRRATADRLIAANDLLTQERATAAGALAEERAARVRAETDLADTQAKLLAANDKIGLAAGDKARAIAAAAKVLLDHAVVNGQVVQGDRERWVVAFNESFGETAINLAKLPRIVPTESLTGGMGGRRPSADPRGQFLLAVNEAAVRIGGPRYTADHYSQAWTLTERARPELHLQAYGKT